MSAGIDSTVAGGMREAAERALGKPALDQARATLPAPDPVTVLHELLSAVDAEIVARSNLSATDRLSPGYQQAADRAYDAAERLDWARGAAQLAIALPGPQ